MRTLTVLLLHLLATRALDEDINGIGVCPAFTVAGQGDPVRIRHPHRLAQIRRTETARCATIL